MLADDKRFELFQETTVTETRHGFSPGGSVDYKYPSTRPVLGVDLRFLDFFQGQSQFLKHQ